MANSISMKTKEMPDADYLNSVFHYCQKTGRLLWKERPKETFATSSAYKQFVTRRAGRSAGCVLFARGGRKYISINLRQGGGPLHYLAHRIIWAMVNGPIPDGMDIDHINRNGLDNRMSNLRLATRSENLQNSVRRNKHGVKGVSLHKKSGLWRSEIMVNMRKVDLGYFKTKGEAAVARAKAAIRYHGEFARLV